MALVENPGDALEATGSELPGGAPRAATSDNLITLPLPFLASVVFSGFMVAAFSEEPVVLISAIILVWFMGGMQVHWDPLHPYTIFGTGMLLYAIAAPLLAQFDLFPRPLYQAAKALQILYLSFVVVYLASWPSRLSSAALSNLSADEFTIGARVVIAIALPLCAISVFYPAVSGFTTKQEIVVSGGVLSRLSYFSALNLGFSFLIYSAIQKNRIATLWSTILPLAAFYVLTIGLVGQRYGFYYLGITTLILFAALRQIKLTHLVILGLTALGLNTLLGGLKLFISASLGGDDILESTFAFYGTDDFNYWLAYEDFISRSFKTALLALLGSEPTTVADNLNTLVDLVPDTYPYSYGGAIVSDLERAFSLGFLQETGSGIGTATQNSSILFNSWVQLEGFLEGSGIGFCLICTGYLDLGVTGALIISLLLGLALRFAYRASTKSVIGLIFYANLIPVVMTSLRQDVSQIISTPLKQLVIPLFIVSMSALLARSQADKTN